MTYLGALCVVAYPVAHTMGCPKMVAMLHIFKTLLDCADGPIARSIGQCTIFGALVDLATDTFAEYTFVGCIGLASYQSQSLPSYFSTLGFSAVLMLWMWWQTIDIALNFYFMGRSLSWKQVRYPCPIARWYYSNNYNHTFLFICFHIFYAGFYLQAVGATHLGLPIICLFALPFLARVRILFVVIKKQLDTMYELELKLKA